MHARYAYMLIQCQSCNTKYRLNLERIPKRKTFVRCKSCGTPIYIDPTEEDAGSGAVIPPGATVEVPGDPPVDTSARATVIPPEGAPAPSQAVAQGPDSVSCPQCSARYRLPESSRNRPGVKLKCSQCNHVFPATAGATQEAAAWDAQPPAAAPMAAGSDPLPPPSGTPTMPVPDVGQMDSMFDDLRPQAGGWADQQTSGLPQPDDSLGDVGGKPFAGEDHLLDPEDAYEEAVDLGHVEQPAANRGKVPDAQKYKLFLNPNEYQGSRNQMAEENKPGDLPPLDGVHEDTDLPPLDDPALDSAASAQTPVATLPGKVNEPYDYDKFKQKREKELNLPPRNLLSEKKRMMLLVAAAVLILAVSAGWGVWLQGRQMGGEAFSMQSGQPHQLQMDSDLKGVYITNKPSGKRLFVVTGEVVNNFEAASEIRWIQLKGMVYKEGDESATMGTASAYAGNLLDEKQLAGWELDAIQAYYGYTNGREDKNYNIPQGAKVPYQLVFTDMREQVGRTMAQVVSYHRGGQAVYVTGP